MSAGVQFSTQNQVKSRKKKVITSADVQSSTIQSVGYGEHFFKVCFTPLYAAACRDLLNKCMKELENSMRSDI